jgi:hypothetical protein
MGKSSTKSYFNRLSILIFLFLSVSSVAKAGDFNFGIGLGVTNGETFNGSDFGLDYQIGYEFKQSENWRYGAQAYIFDGVTDPSYIVPGSSEIMFDGLALFATARPRNAPIILFKAGLVNARYLTPTKSETSTGAAIGVALDLDLGGGLRLNILDFRRYYLGGDVINSYSISAMVLGQ